MPPVLERHHQMGNQAQMETAQSERGGVPQVPRKTRGALPQYFAGLGLFWPAYQRMPGPQVVGCGGDLTTGHSPGLVAFSVKS
jgi:hypothetical protein